MKTIYKYVLYTACNVVGTPKFPYTMELPKGAVILSCGLQNNKNGPFQMRLITVCSLLEQL